MRRSKAPLKTELLKIVYGGYHCASYFSLRLRLFSGGFMSAIPYLVSGVLYRLASRDDDVTIEDEILEGVAAHERGDVKPLTLKNLSDGVFIGEKK